VKRSFRVLLTPLTFYEGCVVNPLLDFLSYNFIVVFSWSNLCSVFTA